MNNLEQSALKFGIFDTLSTAITVFFFGEKSIPSEVGFLYTLLFMLYLLFETESGHVSV